MPFSNPTKNEQGHWVVNYTPDGAATEKTLATYQKYLDGNIILNASAATAVTYGNAPASGKTAASYTDISSTAPVLVSGDYLYINTGYTGDTKISLARLVPEGSDVKGHSEYILYNHTAYDNDGTLVTGTIPINTSSSFTPNAAKFNTSATITTTTTSPSNTGAAINYDDNKCGGSSTAPYYVTISATSSGTGVAGSNKNIIDAGTYMQNAISVTSPAPSLNTPSGDTNYLKASPGGAEDGNAVTNVAVATASAAGELSSGSEYFLSSGTNDFAVEFTASATATASATSTDASAKSVTVKDTYMLDNISVVSKGNSTAATDSDTDDTSVIKYLKVAELQDGTITFDGGAASSTTTIVATTTPPANKGAAVNYNDNKCGGSSEADAYDTITANGTGGAAAITATGVADVTSAGWIAFGEAAGVSGSKTAVSTNSNDTNYIKANTTTEIAANAVSVSAPATVSVTATAGASATASGSITTGMDYFQNTGTYKVIFTANATADATADANATASGTATATAGGNKTLSVKDQYMLNNVTVKSTGATGSISGSGSAIQATDQDTDSKTVTKYIRPGSATPSVTVEGSSSALTSPTAMDNQYFTITPKASVGTNGWITSISDGTQLKYKVKDGSASVTATNVPISTTLSGEVDSAMNQFVVSSSSTGSTTVTGSVTAGWISSISSASVGITDSGAEYRIDIYDGAIA